MICLNCSSWTSSERKTGEGKVEMIEEAYVKFIKAIVAGDVCVIEQLVKDGVNINKSFNLYNFDTLFYKDVYVHDELIQYLFRDEMNLEFSDTKGVSPLVISILSNHNNVFTQLVKHGADIFICDSSNFNALHVAACKCNEEIIEYLVKNGIYIDCKTDTAMTPLMLSSCYGDIKTVKFLLKYGANIMQKDFNGDTALYWSTLHGKADITTHLLQNGSNPKDTDNQGNSILSSLFLEPPSINETSIFLMLIRYGADVNLCDWQDMSPLMRACLEDIDIVVAEELINHGADINFINKDGQDAILYSIYGGYNNKCRLLLNNSANINNTYTEYELTLLMISAIEGNAEITRTLTNHGDMNYIFQKDKYGNTALEYAIINGNHDDFFVIEEAIENKCCSYNKEKIKLEKNLDYAIKSANVLKQEIDKARMKPKNREASILQNIIMNRYTGFANG